MIEGPVMSVCNEEMPLAWVDRKAGDQLGRIGTGGEDHHSGGKKGSIIELDTIFSNRNHSASQIKSFRREKLRSAWRIDDAVVCDEQPARKSFPQVRFSSG